MAPNDNQPAFNDEEVTTQTELYTVFPKWEKVYIVSLITFAAWFSTLSSFIYYPVITFVARDLRTTVANVNLTVTAYMVVSGIAPALIGDLADQAGRRLTYVIALVLYFCANVGIAVQDSFVALLLLRMLQSAGISGTFSIAYGVLVDISTPAERGSYVSALSFGMTTAPTMGPILGGVIGATIGWRWIFWFLSIVSGVCLLLIILTLPETARNIVGNGSTVPSPLYRLPITDIMGRNSQARTDGPNSEVARKSGWHVPNPMACLKVLSRKDTFIVVTAGGIIYMAYSCMQASLSTLCIEIYSLGQLEAGLIYLPFGFGSIALTCVSARSHNLPVDKVRGDNLLTFPVEKARLRSAFIPIGIAALTFVGYGWSLHFHAHLSVPLVLQFLLGLSVQMCFNINNTLLMDINHRTPATAQAASNIIRCVLAAVAVAVLENVMGRIGVGWTFTLLGFGTLGSGLLYWVDRGWGMRWRTESHEGHDATVVMDRADEEGKECEMLKQEDRVVDGRGNEGEKKE
ncbi:MAG: hypothetical protein Q9172_003363 [Xanthocarpia lactea]